MSQGSSFGGFDIPTFSQQSQHLSQHPQQSIHHRGNSPMHEGFLLSMGTSQNCDQTISVTDFNKGDRSKSSASEEDEPSFTTEDGRGKKMSPWHRVKWTDKMVKLLITAVSYLGEDVLSDLGRKKFAVLHKKGKWKCISKVMAERGFHVSPQQCEDKFNDLNKRYKKLNDMLGRGTSCQVVENPVLLDDMNFLSEKEKDDVRKILSSKQLFYEEMCSYHNCNRLALPHDLALRNSLHLALRNRDEHDNDDVRSSRLDDNDEDDLDLENDDRDDFDEDHACHGGKRGTNGTFGAPAKKLKQSQDLIFGNTSNSQGPHPHGMMVQSDVNQVLPENKKETWLQKQWIESRSIQLEEQKLQLQVEMLELEKERLRWQRFCKKKDRDLEKMRMENERLRLENERIALELKQKERGSGFN